MTRPPISNLAGHRDLAGAIGAPPEAVAVPPPAVAAESTPQIAAAGEKAPRSRRKAPTEDDTTKQAVPIYLPAALLAQLRVATTATGESYSDWVLDGYEMVHDRLGERFAPVATRRSGLPPRRRAARRHVETPSRCSCGSLAPSFGCSSRSASKSAGPRGRRSTPQSSRCGSRPKRPRRPFPPTQLTNADTRRGEDFVGWSGDVARNQRHRRHGRAWRRCHPRVRAPRPAPRYPLEGG